MKPEHAELYRNLMAFDIDGPQSVSFPFAARLARENGWSRVFAERVVNEYKRYIFLAATAGRAMTPSEEVDQAWHLHLAYSKSYWQRMCGELLNTPLHHNPTEGGKAEANKHKLQYEDTLRFYRETFGNDAPADIWPATHIRFSRDAEGVRVVTNQNWIIPKKPVLKSAITLAAAIALAVSIGCAGGLNPFDLQGAQYLLFLIPTMIAAIIIGNIYWKIACGPGPDPSAEPFKLTWEQTAYLAGQKNRLATAAIARLVEREILAIDGNDGDQLIRKSGSPEPDSAVEKAVVKSMPLDRTDRGALARLADSVEGAFAEEIHSMEEAGLLMSPSRMKTIAYLGTLPLVLVIVGLGIPRLIMGIQNGKPVTYLVVTLVISSILAFIMTFARLPRTRRGTAALKQLQTANVKLKTGSTWSQAQSSGIPAGATGAMAVALFGTAVLAGSPLDRLKTWYPRQTSDGSGSGCSTGCSNTGGGDGGGGGGDGGGSGCGGCGGGGCGGGGGD